MNEIEQKVPVKKSILEHMVRANLITHLESLDYSACVKYTHEELAIELSKTLGSKLSKTPGVMVVLTASNVRSALEKAHPEEHAAHVKRVADLKQDRKEQKARGEQAAKDLQEIVDRADAAMAAANVAMEIDFTPPSKELLLLTSRILELETKLLRGFADINVHLRAIEAHPHITFKTPPETLFPAPTVEYVISMGKTGVAFSGSGAIPVKLCDKDLSNLQQAAEGACQAREFLDPFTALISERPLDSL